MDLSGLRTKAGTLVRKYRYGILVLLAGIVLMCWPSTGEKTAQGKAADTPAETLPSCFLKPEELEEILCRISGAGEVKVLLTYSAGMETVYHQDGDTTENENGSVVKKETVILSGTDRAEQALVEKVLSPRYQGAVVLCTGGDQPSVKLAVTEAVSKATGLGVDNICVLKMK